MRTRGEYDGYGPWSPAQGFRGATPPTVEITKPAPGSTISASRVTPEVAWVDASGAAMAAWEMLLRDYDNDIILWSEAGQGAYTPRTVPVRLTNRHGYRVEITATSGTGLQTWEQVTFYTDFKPPPTPTLRARFVEETGSVALDATVPAAQGDTPAAVRLRVESSYDDGQSWALVADVYNSPRLVAEDPCPPLGATASYRAVAESELPSEATSEIVTVGTRTCRVWITARGGSPRAWCEDNLKIDAKYGVEKVLETYEGRSKPMVHLGAARPVEISLDGDIFPDGGGSPVGDWLALLDQGVWFRSPRGHRLFGTLTGEVRSSDVAGSPATAISLTVTETEAD